MTAPVTANSAIRSGIMMLGATRWKNAYPKARALRDHMVSAKPRLAGLAGCIDGFTGSLATTFINTAWVQHPVLEAGEIFNQCGSV